jgi:hypothetical protein
VMDKKRRKTGEMRGHEEKCVSFGRWFVLEGEGSDPGQCFRLFGGVATSRTMRISTLGLIMLSVNALKRLSLIGTNLIRRMAVLCERGTLLKVLKVSA